MTALLTRSLHAVIPALILMLSSASMVLAQVNLPPIANAGPDVLVSHGSYFQVVQLNSGSFDPEFLPITFAWTQDSGPPAVISNQNTAVLDVEIPDVGGVDSILTFRLTVTDSEMQSSGDPARVIIGSPQSLLTVVTTGTGVGTVTSSPPGINCGGTCSAPFLFGTTVTLTASPAVGSVFSGWSGGCNGTGTCPMNTDQTVTAIFSSTSPLVNISSRSFVGTGSDAATGGFIIGGSGTKQVLLRGFGPTLADFGVTGVLANPTLDFEWDDDNNPNTPAILLLSNDDWGTSVVSCNPPVVACGTPQQIASTGMSADAYAPTNPSRGLDAALLLTLPPGTYTATLRGVSGGTGVGLIGIDDVGTSQTATLINISTRAFVGTGSDAEVGGLIISGTLPKPVLLRGFGPTLTDFGVTGALANPTLDLEWDHDNNPNTPAILLLSNDDWATAGVSCPAPVVTCGTPTDIANTGMSADSYAPTNPDRELDAALLVTLPPGAYTTTLRGVNNGTGVGLIGVDDLGSPMISNFRVVTISANAVTVAWETDRPATSQVIYRLASGGVEEITPSDGQLRTAHQVTVTGLLANTDYVVRARSTSPSGLASESEPRTVRTRR